MTFRRLENHTGESRSLPVALLLLGAVGLMLPKSSYAQAKLPPLADSWNGVHSFFDLSANDNYTNDYIKSIAWRFDYGLSTGYWDALHAGNPSYIDALNRSATHFGCEGTGLPSNCTPDQLLQWLKTNHPDWILYQPDRVTPLQAHSYKAIITDFTNPDYVNFKWEHDILPVARRARFAIDLEDAMLGNDFVPAGPGKSYGHACGVYDKPGHWVQKFAGKGSYADVQDPQFTIAMIDYLAEIQRRLHAMSPPRLLITNTDPKTIFNDKVLRAKFLASVDGIMIHGGSLGPDWPGGPRKIWLNNCQFIEDLNAAGKGYYSEQSETGAKAGAPGSQPYVRFVLASYLLAKGRHSAIRFRPDVDPHGYTMYWPPEFDAAHSGKGVVGAKGIGTPLSPMHKVAGKKDSEDGLFLREYTGGVSLVNASHKTPYTAKLPAGNHKDLDGKTVESPVKVEPLTGLVLLRVSDESESGPN